MGKFNTKKNNQGKKKVKNNQGKKKVKKMNVQLTSSSTPSSSTPPSPSSSTPLNYNEESIETISGEKEDKTIEFINDNNLKEVSRDELSSDLPQGIKNLEFSNNQSTILFGIQKLVEEPNSTSDDTQKSSKKITNKKIYPKINEIHFLNDMLNNNYDREKNENDNEPVKKEHIVYKYFKNTVIKDSDDYDKIVLLIIDIIDELILKEDYKHVVNEFEFLIKDNIDYYDYYQFLNILEFIASKYRFVLSSALYFRVQPYFKQKKNIRSNRFEPRLNVGLNDDELHKMFHITYKYDNDYFKSYVHKSYHESYSDIYEKKKQMARKNEELLKMNINMDYYKKMHDFYSYNNKIESLPVEPLHKPVLSIDDDDDDNDNPTLSSKKKRDSKNYACGYKPKKNSQLQSSNFEEEENEY